MCPENLAKTMIFDYCFFRAEFLNISLVLGTPEIVPKVPNLSYSETNCTKVSVRHKFRFSVSPENNEYNKNFGMAEYLAESRRFSTAFI